MSAITRAPWVLDILNSERDADIRAGCEEIVGVCGSLTLYDDDPVTWIGMARGAIRVYRKGARANLVNIRAFNREATAIAREIASRETRAVSLLAHALTAEQIAGLWELGVSQTDSAEATFPAGCAELEELRASTLVGAMNAGKGLARRIIDAGIPNVVAPGGSPAFMAALVAQLTNEQSERLVPRLLFAHSARVVHEKLQMDGRLVKLSEFKHLGWIEMEF